ncbi:DUF2637 domain-containing protein [Brevibacterium luteolum]|uniref:DUF2637 domain-containing protein n=1 Tax=Brevibacterium luteolum TaxID=199591 RepID=UPI001C2391E4|nr:DUF2637 domain-containing protein [Brevibacterium luteolum]MBU8577610.1 DUF2637 domain-containing protein [Brevibacterium luteolum]
MSRGAGLRWAVVAAASGTVLIAAGAFWLSFIALADLAARSGVPAGQAWLWPLLVDGLIVVATVAVVALDRRRAAWYPWTLLVAGALMSVTANAAHALVTADATVPGVLAGAVAAVPPLVLLASTHLTVVLTRPAAPETDASVAVEPERAVLDVPEAVAPASVPPEPAALGWPAPLTVDAPAVEPVPTEPAPPEPAPTRAEPAGQAAVPEPESTAPTGASSGRRERAEALRAAGWSNKQIARELGVHASTVGRWLPRPEPLAAPEPSEGAEKTEDDTKKEKES